jgi:hypothetical protein
MTKLTNYLVTVTDTKETLAVSVGQTAPANSDRITISEDSGGFSFGTVGVTPTFCLADNSPVLTNPDGKCPVYQDLIPRTVFSGIVNTFFISATGNISSPVINCTYSEFSYVISLAASAGATTGTTTLTASVTPNITLKGTSVRLVYFGASLAVPGVDYNVVAYNGNPAPFAIGYLQIELLKPIVSGTPYNIIFNAQFNAIYGTFSLSEAVYGTDGCYGPFTNNQPNAAVCTYVEPTTTTTSTSTSTTTTTSTSTTTTTTTLCPTCTYATSIGTTTSCSGGTATQNISINSSCNNSEARLSAVGNGAVTTGWLNVSSGTAIYSFTSVPIGTYRVEVRPKSLVTTCPSQFSGNFNVCCNTSATWTNTGSQYCDGCAIKQLQTDTNFCSSTYNTTRVITISASDASCGTWGPQTQYCPNYGVYPFQLRTRETNTCGQTRNDSLVANLSPTCGYSCGYWGLSVIFNGYFCNNTTNGSGVVTISVGVANGSYEARLVSTGAGVTTGWLAGNTFTGVYDGTYYAEVRSTSDNSCTASTVGTGQNYQTVACCSTTPNWVDNGAAYCDTCVSKQPQIDNNPCSSSYNQTRVINAGSACNTTQNWVNTGSYNCYGTCNKYNVEIQNNPCASGYNTTRQGSVAEYGSTFCGGCCGQSTAANWVNSGSYNCYGSCTKYNVEVDNNGCSPTYNQTRQGSAVEFNSSFCGGCCGSSPSANWVNNGATYCDGCYLQQPQIDDNPCSSTYGDTRNVDLGVNTACGAWVQSFYCVGYDKWSKETNTCTGNIRDQYLVEVNSAYCGYVPPPACRTYQIVGDYTDESVNGIYTNCSGGSDSFSFFGGPGTVGYICALAGSVYVTSGNGSANDVGGC